MIKGAQKVIPVYLLVKEFITANKKRRSMTLVSAFLIFLVWRSVVLESFNQKKTFWYNSLKSPGAIFPISLFNFKASAHVKEIASFVDLV